MEMNCTLLLEMQLLRNRIVRYEEINKSSLLKFLTLTRILFVPIFSSAILNLIVFFRHILDFSNFVATLNVLLTRWTIVLPTLVRHRPFPCTFDVYESRHLLKRSRCTILREISKFRRVWTVCQRSWLPL